MKHSAERFLTTHTGSLPRPDDLVRMMYAKEEGVPVDAAALAARVRAAVVDVVRRQRDAGVDLVNDGELSKPSYATYIKDRLDGFGGTGNTFVYQDLAEFPRLAQRVFGDPGRSRRKTPACNAPISVRDRQAALSDVDNLTAGIKASGGGEAFMSAASPGVVSLFFRNDHYPSQEAYLDAIAEAMRVEYECVTNAGVVLQIDCPDLAMGRHIQYADLSLAEFRKRARHTSRRSTTRSAISRPISFAFTCAGATTRGRIIATSRSPISSTSCSWRGRTRSRSKPPIHAMPTNGSCSRRSSCPTTRS